MFIGDELQSILDSIESGAEYTDVYKTKMDLGAAVLPPIPKDTTDRNRTSPFAFTGNKFEFRIAGFGRQHRVCKRYAEYRSCRGAPPVR